jgi:hypothetical protein
MDWTLAPLTLVLCAVLWLTGKVIYIVFFKSNVRIPGDSGITCLGNLNAQEINETSAAD